MDRRTFLGVAALVLGGAIAYGIRKTDPPVSDPNPPIVAQKKITITEDQLAKLYTMQPPELAKALNDLNDKYKLARSKIQDNVELANIVRLMYFEEEFYRHVPGENDERFYKGFRGIAEVYINRVLFTNQRLDGIETKFVDRNVDRKFGKNFDQLINWGKADQPIRSANLRGFEFNCLWKDHAFFTGGYNSRDIDGKKKFDYFAITEQRPGESIPHSMYQATLGLAVKAFVDAYLRINGDKNPEGVVIGNSQADITHGATFYKNDSIKGVDDWCGKWAFEGNEHYVVVPGEKLGGHTFYSIALTENGFAKLSREEKLKYSEKTFLTEKGNQFQAWIRVYESLAKK